MTENMEHSTVMRHNIETDVMLRLEKGFTDQQLSFQNTRDDVNALKLSYSVMQRDMLNIGSSIEKLIARFEDSRKMNWPMLALLGGLLPIVIAGLGFFVTSYTAGAVAPVHTEMAQSQVAMKSLSEQVKEIAAIQNSRGRDLSVLAQAATTNTEVIGRLTTALHTVEQRVTADADSASNSRTDRTQLNERMKKVEEVLGTEITERRTANAQTRIQLGEVEQQFHSVSNLENLRHAQQERLNSMMWEKIHPGERYPSGTFFPTSIFQGTGGSPPLN